MARTVRDTQLETRGARARLGPRSEPYWRTIDQGAHLGYYRGQRVGSWVARQYLSGRYRKITLGIADDVTDSNGIAILSFAQAQAAARVWFADAARREAGVAAPSGPFTVSQALDEYMADYRRRGGKSATDTESRINAMIKPHFLGAEVSKLTTQRLRSGHATLAAASARLRTAKGAKKQNERPIAKGDAEAIRRRRATSNRTLTVLKAALNHSFREGRVASDDAWRRVQPFREAEAAKVCYLTREEARRLVNASDPTFRPLVQAALLTGCRYGEIIKLRVGDLDHHAGTITVRAAKGGKPRHVVLTGDGVTLFYQFCAGRPLQEIVFTRPDGGAWGPSHQRRPLQEAETPFATTAVYSCNQPLCLDLEHLLDSNLIIDGLLPQPVISTVPHALRPLRET